MSNRTLQQRNRHPQAAKGLGVKSYTTVVAVFNLYCHSKNVKSSRKDLRMIGKKVKLKFKESAYKLKDLAYFTQFEAHKEVARTHRVNAYPEDFAPVITSVIKTYFEEKEQRKKK